jgi:hypothetical protein
MGLTWQKKASQSAGAQRFTGQDRFNPPFFQLTQMGFFWKPVSNSAV